MGFFSHRRTPAAMIVILCLGSAGCATAAPSGGSGADEGTVSPPGADASAGYYTAAQGSRGAEVFGSSCGGCHTEREFSGRIFELSWGGKSLFEFYDYIRSAMPYDAPGSLSDQEYTDIVAYVLQNNGYSAGTGELPPHPEALSAIRFD